MIEGIVLDINTLRKDYRDSIIQLLNSAIHRKNVDDSTLAGSCYICLRGWEIKEEVTTLRCECISWAHTVKFEIGFRSKYYMIVGPLFALVVLWLVHFRCCYSRCYNI
jgi:hypothetical protein